MLSAGRFEIVGGRVCHVPAGVIRHNCDVIAYFILDRIAFERGKCIAHRHIGRPRNTAIGAVGVKQLRVGVVSRVARIEPNRIDPSIRRHSKRAEPVPLIRIHWIVVDPLRRTKALATVGAAGEHHVCSAAAERLHTCQHINIVVRGATRTINCQEALSSKPAGVNRAAKNQAAAQIHLRALIKRWCDARVLRISGANAPERAGKVACAANKDVAIAGYIECSKHGRIRDKDGTHPSDPAIGGAAELSPAPIVAARAPGLVLETMPCSVGGIYCEPLLIAPGYITKGQARPSLATVCRAPHVVIKGLPQTEVEKSPCLIRI